MCQPLRTLHRTVLCCACFVLNNIRAALVQVAGLCFTSAINCVPHDVIRHSCASLFAQHDCPSSVYQASSFFDGLSLIVGPGCCVVCKTVQISVCCWRPPMFGHRAHTCCQAACCLTPAHALKARPITVLGWLNFSRRRPARDV